MKFKVGDRVIVNDLDVLWHDRIFKFLTDKIGTIIQITNEIHPGMPPEYIVKLDNNTKNGSGTVLRKEFELKPLETPDTIFKKLLK